MLSIIISAINDAINSAVERLRGADECGWTRDRLSEYVDGELTPADLARVEAHLASCDACSEEALELRLTVDALRAVPSVRVPRSFVIPAPALAPASPASAGFWPSARSLSWATGAVGTLFALALAWSAVIQPAASLAPYAAPAAAPTTAAVQPLVRSAPEPAAAASPTPAAARAAAQPAAAPTSQPEAAPASGSQDSAAPKPTPAAAAAPTQAPAPEATPAAALAARPTTAAAAATPIPPVASAASAATPSGTANGAGGQSKAGQPLAEATPAESPLPPVAAVAPTRAAEPTVRPAPTSAPAASGATAESSARQGTSAGAAGPTPSGDLTVSVGQTWETGAGPLEVAAVALGGLTVALAGVTGVTWLRERRTRRNGGSE